MEVRAGLHPRLQLEQLAELPPVTTPAFSLQPLSHHRAEIASQHLQRTARRQDASNAESDLFMARGERRRRQQSVQCLQRLRGNAVKLDTSTALKRFHELLCIVLHGIHFHKRWGRFFFFFFIFFFSALALQFRLAQELGKRLGLGLQSLANSQTRLSCRKAGAGLERVFLFLLVSVSFVLSTIGCEADAA